MVCNWELYPNPDYELVHIDVPRDSTLHQVVIDTVFTVPALSGYWVPDWSASSVLKEKPRNI
ncbi:MAG: hypothetical protein HGJ94_14215 [Desulfosarcina sp.]|nr:hypothetical protein [Desulfosarcina sp.]